MSCWPDARITLLYQSVQSYCAVISLVVFSFCLFACLCELLARINCHFVKVYNHFTGRLLFLSMSCWLFVCLFVCKIVQSKCTVILLSAVCLCELLTGRKHSFSKCRVNVPIVFFCLFVCELLAGHRLHFVKVYS